MRNNCERADYVFDLWANQNMPFKEIARTGTPGFLSLTRIRNIVYGGKGQLKSDLERKIYKIFQVKFMEVKNVHQAICFAHQNQPRVSITERHVRRIIKKKLTEKQQQNDLSH